MYMTHRKQIQGLLGFLKLTHEDRVHFSRNYLQKDNHAIARIEQSIDCLRKVNPYYDKCMAKYENLNLSELNGKRITIEQDLTNQANIPTVFTNDKEDRTRIFQDGNRDCLKNQNVTGYAIPFHSENYDNCTEEQSFSLHGIREMENAPKIPSKRLEENDQMESSKKKRKKSTVIDVENKKDTIPKLRTKRSRQNQTDKSSKRRRTDKKSSKKRTSGNSSKRKNKKRKKSKKSSKKSKSGKKSSKRRKTDKKSSKKRKSGSASKRKSRKRKNSKKSSKKRKSGNGSKRKSGKRKKSLLDHRKKVKDEKVNEVSKSIMKEMFGCDHVSHINAKVHEFGWPNIYPEGKGGYDKKYAEENSLWTFDEWCRIRFAGADGRARWDPSYVFYTFDRSVQSKIAAYNNATSKKGARNKSKTNSENQHFDFQSSKTKKENIESFFKTSDSKLGKFVSPQIPGCEENLIRTAQNVTTFAHRMGSQNLFFTFTQNPHWPELIDLCERDPQFKQISQENTVQYGFESAYVYFARWKFVRKYLIGKDSMLGCVLEYVVNTEHQDRKIFHQHGIFFSVPWHRLKEYVFAFLEIDSSEEIKFKMQEMFEHFVVPDFIFDWLDEDDSEKDKNAIILEAKKYQRFCKQFIELGIADEKQHRHDLLLKWSKEEHLVWAHRPDPMTKFEDLKDFEKPFFHQLKDLYEMCIALNTHPEKHGVKCQWVENVHPCIYGYPKDLSNDYKIVNGRLSAPRYEECDRMIVAYNPIFALLGGNHSDFELCTNDDAQHYMCKYISKISNLYILKNFTNNVHAYIHGRLVPGPEAAAYFLRGMYKGMFQLFEMSRRVCKIDVEQTRFRKFLPKMNLAVPDMIDHYINRPESLENLTLKKFVEQYQVLTPNSTLKGGIEISTEYYDRDDCLEEKIDESLILEQLGIDDEKMGEEIDLPGFSEKRHYRILKRNRIAISRMTYSTVSQGYKYYKALITCHVPFRNIEDFVSDKFEKYGEYSWKMLAKETPEIKDWIVDDDLEIFIDHYKSLDSFRGTDYDIDKLYHCINFSTESGLSLEQIDKILKQQDPPLSCILDFHCATDNVSEGSKDSFYLGRLYASIFKSLPLFDLLENHEFQNWKKQKIQKIDKMIDHIIVNCEEQAMCLFFMTGDWWDPNLPRPPFQKVLEVSGNAGSGKSFLSELLYLKSLLKNNLVTHSLAAQGTGANRASVPTCTIHRFTGMGYSNRPSSRPAHQWRHLNAEMILIDEVHSVSANTINATAQQLQNVYKEFYGTRRAPIFGRASVQINGDVLQLEAVLPEKNGGMFCESELWKNLPYRVFLKDDHRNKAKDIEFVNFLKKFRVFFDGDLEKLASESKRILHPRRCCLACRIQDKSVNTLSFEQDLLNKFPHLITDHTCTDLEKGHTYNQKTCQCVSCPNSIFLIGKNKEVREVNDSIIAAEPYTWKIKSQFLCGTPLQPVDSDKLESLEKAEKKHALVFPIDMYIQKGKKYLYMHNTNPEARFAKGTIIEALSYNEKLEYLVGRNLSTGRKQIVKKFHLKLPKKPRDIHDSSLVQYTLALLYIDAMTMHRVQGASLDYLVKMMIHQELWVATQIYVAISRTTDRKNLHILLLDDKFFDKTMKELYLKENLQTCLKANTTILKDDLKFRKMFDKVKEAGHMWYDSSNCNCTLCKKRKKYESKLLQNLQINETIAFKNDNKEIVGQILKMYPIENNSRKVQLLYKTWINSTILESKTKIFTLTNQFEIITNLLSI